MSTIYVYFISNNTISFSGLVRGSDGGRHLARRFLLPGICRIHKGGAKAAEVDEAFHVCKLCLLWLVQSDFDRSILLLVLQKPAARGPLREMPDTYASYASALRISFTLQLRWLCRVTGSNRQGTAWRLFRRPGHLVFTSHSSSWRWDYVRLPSIFGFHSVSFFVPCSIRPFRDLLWHSSRIAEFTASERGPASPPLLGFVGRFSDSCFCWHSWFCLIL